MSSRSIVSVVVVVLGVLASASTPALAAAPEAPQALPPAPLAATSATLHGVLNPGKAGGPFELGHYEFVYEQSATECEGASKVVTAAGLSLGGGKEEVSQAIEGLQAGTQYTVCLVVYNEADTETASSAPLTFTTPVAAPKLEESVIDVASTSATLDAEINPGGTATTYTFEYAPVGGTFAPLSEAEGSGSIAAGGAGVPLSVHIDGLQPSTSYEFRVVVANSVETVTGEPVSFTTQRSGQFTLPDERQYEMVTPPQKEGSLFKQSFNPESGSGYGLEDEARPVPVQASAAGSAIVDEADQPVEGEPQGDANGVMVLSSRGPAGWSSQEIPAPHDESTGPAVGAGQEYRLFSEDLSRGVLQQFGNFAPLAPEAVESTPYLHTDYLNGNVEERCDSPDLSQGSCFLPLVTRADTQAGVVFGDKVDGECSFFECGPEFVAGTPDLSHVVLASREQLTSTPIRTEYNPVGYLEKPPLYEWYGGQLQLLNILPGAQEGDGELQLALGNKRHVISDNGERVILENVQSNGTGGGGDLYLRDVAKGETIALNVPEPGCGTCGTGGGGVYMTANDEGSRIFFSDTSKLTSSSAEGSADLYECEIVEVEGRSRCDLSDLTPETGGEVANVKVVLGVSEDGSYVYFIAGGALAPGAVGQACHVREVQEEPCNLYVRHDGATTFIAKLASGDGDFFGIHSEFAPISYGVLRARVSPDGRWLAFMSHRDLTGYDSHDTSTGQPDEEVYLYDANTGTLSCASCDPTGARPTGVSSDLGEARNYRIASILPGWVRYENAEASGIEQIYQPRYLSNSGRLFFDSKDALVPRDVNGAIDVYEYEPEGVPVGEHACSSATQSGSETFKPVQGFEVEGDKGEEAAGCVALLSSGTSPEESTFLDASQTGGDVFVLTTSKLATQDFDNAPDIYDAHECTASSPCVPVQAQQPPPCETEGSCRGAPAAQPSLYGAPSSATFDGAGNLTPTPSATPKKVAKKAAKCKKGFVKNKKGKCVKKPKKRSKKLKKKSKKAKKASNDRRDR
jgi:hypothetical protein